MNRLPFVLVLVLTAPLPAAVTVLRFDELAVGTAVTRQYEAQGVVFSADEVRIVHASPPGTLSGVQALEAIYGTDIPYHPGPVRFTFSSLQKRVRVHVGQHFGSNDARSQAVLRVYGSAGKLIEKKYVAIGAGPRTINIPLEIDTGSNQIRRAEVQFLRQDSLDGVYFDIDTNGVEIIDSLTFEGLDPPPPPPDDPPVVRITTPANNHVFFGNHLVRLEGTITEAVGLGRLTLRHISIEQDPDPPPAALDWTGAAPTFSFPRFPDVFRVSLRPGRNRLTVEAEDSRVQLGSASVDVIYATAPEVIIDRPFDDATLTGTEYVVYGRIVKPYGTLTRERVTIDVESFGTGPVAVDTLSGSAAAGYSFNSRVVLDDRAPSMPNRIVVTAVDEGGARGSAAVDVRVTRPNRILARELHVTQAVLSSRLIARRVTVARVFAHALLTDGARGVNCELYGYRDGVELPGSPIMPLGEDRLDLVTGVTLQALEVDAAKSWNFLLPASWRNSTGNVELVAVVDAENDLQECVSCLDDNVIERAVTFSEGEELRIQPLAVSYVDAADHLVPTSEEIAFALRGIARTFPYGRLTILPTITHRSRLESNGNILDRIFDRFTCYDLNVQDFWDIFGAIEDAFAGCSWSTYYVGFLPMWRDPAGDVVGCPGGLAYLPSPACVTEPNPWVAAQEVAHCVGLSHAGNDHDENDGGGYDPRFPYPHGGIGRTGFDATALVAIPTAEPYPVAPALNDRYCRGCDVEEDTCHSHDFLSYGDGVKWVSPYTWENLYTNGFTGSFGIGAAAAAADGEGAAIAVSRLLHVMGRIDETGAVAFRPFYPVIPREGFQLPVGNGVFEVRALDGAGNVLGSRRFDPRHTTHEDEGRISILAPFPEGSARIDVLRDGGTVLTRPVSGHAPTVRVLFPNGGESFGPGQAITVRWESNDADGDPLRHGLQYSPDGGTTWENIAFDIEGDELEVDSAGLRGGSGLMRVLATDGVLASRDASDGTFMVSPKPPRPFILFPADGMAIDADDSIVLDGSAADLEEGTLPDDALSWSSSLDGFLARGASVDVPRLTTGVHQIRLEAQDDSGARGSVEITLHVGAREQETFVRADANGQDGVDIADPISLLTYLFSGGTQPACDDAADANDDGTLDISDALYTLSYLFIGGAAPLPPFPEAGTDPTPDTLGCRS